MSVQNEIRVLEDKLKEVDGWEARVKELEALLSVQEGVDGIESNNNNWGWGGGDTRLYLFVYGQ